MFLAQSTFVYILFKFSYMFNVTFQIVWLKFIELFYFIFTCLWLLSVYFKVKKIL